jgi:hypothetical protein
VIDPEDNIRLTMLVLTLWWITARIVLSVP